MLPSSGGGLNKYQVISPERERLRPVDSALARKEGGSYESGYCFFMYPFGNIQHNTG